MTDFKFGELVIDDMGDVYMVIGPYTGERLENDSKGPASWVTDVDTQYSREGDGGVVWASNEILDPYR